MKFAHQQLSSITRWSTTFVGLCAAAEGCIVPFLTIYFRQLGLPSSKIGILLGARVLVGTSMGPFWRQMSRKFQKQKFLMIFSILTAILFRIGLSFIPPISSEFLLDYCADNRPSVPQAELNISTLSYENHTPVSFHEFHAKNETGNIQESISRRFNFLHNGNYAYESHRVPLLRKRRIQSNYSQENSNTSSSSEVDVFITALIVVMLGELFSSSGILLVRSSLYHHLDDTDNLNLFPVTQSIYAISHGLSAAVISGAVDQIPCIILGDRSSMIIQIACSVLILIITVIISFFVPLFQPQSLLHSTNRAVKAFRFLYSDLHHILLVSSCTILGLLSSAASGFFFWYVQDLGGTEFSMGVYLLLESLSHSFIYFRSVWLLRKFGHFGIFGLNFLCLSLTYLYFGMIWNPWMALLITPLSGLVHTLFWESVSDLLEQNAPPGLYLQTFRLLEIFSALGSVAGFVSVGFMGSVIHFKFVFVIFGILASIWGGVGLLVIKFVPRKDPYRYAQLFQSSGDFPVAGDSEEEFVSEDWLEKALEEEVR